MVALVKKQQLFVVLLYIHIKVTIFTLNTLRSASVAHSDGHLTGDQEVTGSTPAESETFFHGDLIMKYFLQSFSPFH